MSQTEANTFLTAFVTSLKKGEWLEITLEDLERAARDTPPTEAEAIEIGAAEGYEGTDLELLHQELHEDYESLRNAVGDAIYALDRRRYVRTDTR